MRKTLALTTTLIIALSMTACGNTSSATPSTTPSSTVAPTSTVAEVKEPYIAIGGINPYEELTPTEEANIKKAEEEARLQAEAKAKADAEAKAKAQAEAKKQAEAQQAQAQANQQEVAEQPQQMAKAEPAQQAEASSGDYRLHTYPDGTTVRIWNSPYLAHKACYEDAPDEKSRQQAWAMMQDDLANGRY